MKRIVFLVLSLIVLNSCRTQKDVLYFQNINQVIDPNLKDKFSEPTIQIGDELSIIVSASNADLAKDFNLVTNYGSLSGTKQVGYLVGQQGTIDMPILGKIQVEGKTRNELTLLIKEKLQEKYLKDPIVNVRINNYKVVMLGEFVKPGIKTFDTDKVSIMDAIGSAGDMKLSAIRDSVLVVRNIDGIRTKGYLNLKDANAMKSPYFYLKQNDIVYAMPTKSASMAFNNLPINAALSVVGFTLTIIALFR